QTTNPCPQKLAEPGIIVEPLGHLLLHGPGKTLSNTIELESNAGLPQQCRDKLEAITPQKTLRLASIATNLLCRRDWGKAKPFWPQQTTVWSNLKAQLRFIPKARDENTPWG
ncbi:hypothetical protein TorRG33x02_039530, partial [Trema orientale]